MVGVESVFNRGQGEGVSFEARGDRQYIVTDADSQHSKYS